MTAIRFAVAALAVALPAPSPAAQMLSGQPNVIDGDTFDLAGKRVRLHGVDAPEGRQTCTRANGKTWPCGRDASQALASKIGNGRLTCTQVDTDEYGRVVATCTLGGEDLGAWLVSSGFAFAYREFSDAYILDEAEARTAQRGVWQGNTIVRPAQYRTQTSRAPTPAPAPPGAACTIKGNIGNDGERIYHAPGSEAYARTIITPARGERWFCSEAEARAAGWRESRQ